MSILEQQQITAEQVSDYLLENPSFFLNRPHLLADIALPHDSGNAVSLLERQVSILRERNIETRKRLSEMLEQGQRNDGLFEQTQRLTLQLLETNNINRLMAQLHSFCIDQFQVDAVCLTLVANDLTHKVNQCQVLAENEIKQVLPGLLQQTKGMSGSFRQEELALLFAGNTDIASAIVMPIVSQKQAIGFLSLGSDDAAYFSHAMDSLFLSFIVNILAVQIPKYLR
ncbi:MAG: DUF484 family protein [Pseudomonadales bacterium]|nr:DUF484 family protein [Pseudomonadales bacterium]